MKFIKDNLIAIIVSILLVLVLLQRCEQPVVEAPKVVRDTILVVKESFTTTKPQVVKTIEIESHDTIITQQHIPHCL